MPIDMTDFKMIYKDRVYNVLQMMLDFGIIQEGEKPQPKFIDAIYIDENGMVASAHDEARCFQFIRNIKKEGDI